MSASNLQRRPRAPPSDPRNPQRPQPRCCPSWRPISPWNRRRSQLAVTPTLRSTACRASWAAPHMRSLLGAASWSFLQASPRTRPRPPQRRSLSPRGARGSRRSHRRRRSTASHARQDRSKGADWEPTGPRSRPSQPEPPPSAPSGSPRSPPAWLARRREPPRRRRRWRRRRAAPPTLPRRSWLPSANRPLRLGSKRRPSLRRCASASARCWCRLCRSPTHPAPESPTSSPSRSAVRRSRFR